MRRRRNWQFWLTRNRVVLALYWLAEPDGLICLATPEQIAGSAGRSVQTVREQLRDLRFAGLIYLLGPIVPGDFRWAKVLMDHPDADALIRGHRPDWRGIEAALAELRALEQNQILGSGYDPFS